MRDESKLQLPLGLLEACGVCGGSRIPGSQILISALILAFSALRSWHHRQPMSFREAFQHHVLCKALHTLPCNIPALLRGRG